VLLTAASSNASTSTVAFGTPQFTANGAPALSPQPFTPARGGARRSSTQELFVRSGHATKLSRRVRLR
jgi:hypothetical protein